MTLILPSESPDQDLEHHVDAEFHGGSEFRIKNGQLGNIFVISWEPEPQFECRSFSDDLPNDKPASRPNFDKLLRSFMRVVLGISGILERFYCEILRVRTGRERSKVCDERIQGYFTFFFYFQWCIYDCVAITSHHGIFAQPNKGISECDCFNFERGGIRDDRLWRSKETKEQTRNKRESINANTHLITLCTNGSDPVSASPASVGTSSLASNKRAFSHNFSFTLIFHKLDVLILIICYIYRSRSSFFASLWLP